MKKVLIAILMSTVMVGSLSACGSEQGNNQGATVASQQVLTEQVTTEPQKVGVVGMWQGTYTLKTSNQTENLSLNINADATFLLTAETDEISGVMSGTYTVDSTGAVTLTSQKETITDKATGKTRENTSNESNNKVTGKYNSANDTMEMTSSGETVVFTRVS